MGTAASQHASAGQRRLIRAGMTRISTKRYDKSSLISALHAYWCELSARLGAAEWLDGTFSAGDLEMISALPRLEGSALLEEYPNLCAYIARGQVRPAYRRAFEAQKAVFLAALAGGQ